MDKHILDPFISAFRRIGRVNSPGNLSDHILDRTVDKNVYYCTWYLRATLGLLSFFGAVCCGRNTRSADCCILATYGVII